MNYIQRLKEIYLFSISALFSVDFLQLQDLILVMVSSRSRLISLKFKIIGKRTMFSMLGLVLLRLSQEFILGPITVTSVLESIDWSEIGLVPILRFRRWGQSHLNDVHWVCAVQFLQKNWSDLKCVWWKRDARWAKLICPWEIHKWILTYFAKDCKYTQIRNTLLEFLHEDVVPEKWSAVA